jgi:hypothetical protein
MTLLIPLVVEYCSDLNVSMMNSMFACLSKGAFVGSAEISGIVLIIFIALLGLYARIPVSFTLAIGFGLLIALLPSSSALYGVLFLMEIILIAFLLWKGIRKITE